MIIGFIGFMQSGKTTAAIHLQEKHGFVRVNFKDALVAEMKQNLTLTMEDMCKVMERLDFDSRNPWNIDRLFRDKPPMFRALMQNYGTEIRRSDNEWYWIKKWSEVASETPFDIVVDDVRFINEAECIKNAGGHLVRIERTDIASAGDHPSETELSGFSADKTISVGKGEIEKLYQEVDVVVDLLRK